MIIEWTHHPVTQKFHKEINAIKDQIVQNLINGSTLGDHAEQKTAELVGRLRSIELIENINLKEEEDENGI